MGGGGGGGGGGGDTFLPTTTRRSVKFRDLKELNLRQFSTNHFQTIQFYQSTAIGFNHRVILEL